MDGMIKSTSAARMRRHRERRHRGLFAVWVELRKSEVDYLIRQRLPLCAPKADAPAGVALAFAALVDSGGLITMT
jgi:hypothetical protein